MIIGMVSNERVERVGRSAIGDVRSIAIVVDITRPQWSRDIDRQRSDVLKIYVITAGYANACKVTAVYLVRI